MTYKTETGGDSKRILQSLVLIFIVWVAFWASTGGLDRILSEDTATAVVHTSI